MPLTGRYIRNDGPIHQQIAGISDAILRGGGSKQKAHAFRLQAHTAAREGRGLDGVYNAAQFYLELVDADLA